MKATSDGPKRKEKVKWVVSVIYGNELNMPNKAQRASALGKNKKHFVAKKTKMEKNMDSEGWMWRARKRNSMKLLRKIKSIYLD